MATEKGSAETAGGRLTLLIALALLAAVSAAALGRVFRGPGPWARLALCAAVAVALAGALERRHVLLATLVSAAGLLVAVGLLVFPSTTRLWLPTLTTLRSALTALRDVSRTADATVAPALPLQPLFLAALIAVWTASFSAHSLAVRSRSPFLAMLPPGALLAFASLIMEDGPRPAYVLGFLVGCLAVLFADGLWRIRQWGPTTGWRGRKAPALTTRPGLRTARRVAVVCLGIALFTPWILPGFRADGLVDASSQSLGVGISVDPIVDIRPQLLRNPAAELFTVRSSSPAYWRFESLDVFDGQRWTASNDSTSNGVLVTNQDLPALTPPTDHMRTVQQQYYFTNLRTTYLPAAFDPIHVNVPPGVVYVQDPSLLVATKGADRGFQYSVYSRESVPTSAQLDAVKEMDSSDTARYTELPRDTPSQLVQIAQNLTKGAPSIYRKILRIQDYLRTSFRYDTHVRPGQNTNQLLYFLTTSKAGYCEQFAGAMAALLRAIGIPARVAVGYTTGQLDRHDPSLYHVTTQNAHAWVEVPFPGYGWLSFEPTPTRINPVSQGYAFPPVPSAGGQQPCVHRFIDNFAVPCGNTSPGASTPQPRGGGRTPARDVTGGQLGGGGSRHRGPLRSPLLWLALGLVVLLAVASIPVAKRWRRRLAISRARAPRELVLAAYRGLASEASDVGLGRRPSETLWEYHSRLKERVAFSNGDIDRLVGLAGRAVYSDREISGDVARQAADAASHARREIRSSVGLSRRLAGSFRIGLPTPSRRD